MILVDKGSRIHITVLTTDVAVEVQERGDLQVFLDWWKETARGRGAPLSYDGADWGQARLLLKQHGLSHLKELAKVFWSQHADPLVTGQYSRHMVLFRSRIAETEKDLSTRA